MNPKQLEKVIEEVKRLDKIKLDLVVSAKNNALEAKLRLQQENERKVAKRAKSSEVYEDEPRLLVDRP